jgi:hypothetical protein
VNLKGKGIETDGRFYNDNDNGREESIKYVSYVI